ncbi:FtsK/SpoIIIE domain-containing protein [Enterococcus faecium]|uniref:FtsK/SpoIIIE domain-containing protein n=1 Tax=Enterococcus TaxID=1350 RepID=UPI0008A975BF|nr:FtsK/SpoIIIE domain-containing protein [Enterococcus sp. HMSC072F02]MDB7281319.1 FtsK/SpoIIIE domain-containing protein [Enterococcus faecium]MDB7283934.1 FtsK/SpoIIIE domain-containing protein [Enterococcus faecium]MDB7289041.1 FtsK/SpoIIIE domain-containing protein [Enterococcus faecium]MDB7294126.1 FtsK/SpoIIIE domain-containing protein [Enterococcus faecium]MDB7304121.1 FtsK/SpoIIIE domain-containing protein [Enterococcus faecium]
MTKYFLKGGRPIFQHKGKRVRGSDKHLVYHFALHSFTIIFLFTSFFFHLPLLLKMNWQTIQLKDGLQFIQSPCFLSSLITALFLCLNATLLFRHFCSDTLKQLQHRQKLARMILENGWYETKEITNDGFFKDLSSSKTKEKISHFPKMFYRLKDGFIHIQVEITMGKYQDQLLQLEKKLESGLFCELVEKNLIESYVEYILLYDTIGNRISIDQVTAKDGQMKLMEGVYWEFDALPHMLIAGGTGGGKTYFLLTLIESLLHTNANLFILDPKNADLADLETVMPNVYSKKEDMLACIQQFYDEMMQRNTEMKHLPNYKTGENYAYLGLPANFLIFDEYVAFMDMLGRENAEVLSKLKQIVMLGRQSGFFLILACQRPDAKYFGEGIRDNFNFRVALGRMSELGYGMMFGSDTNKQFFLKPIKGRGYVDTGKNVISEFYTPLVPKGYDFLEKIEHLTTKKQADTALDEVIDAGAD